MSTIIFDKTDKGREEISTRKFQLPARLRTLLVMVDGKQPKDALLEKVAGLGITESNLDELRANGFIQEVATAAPALQPAMAPAKETAPPPEKNAQENVLPDGQNQFQAIYQFYTETIKSTIGLRGYGLQLKVEKASSIDDFRDLRKPYVEAVLNAKGSEMARSLRDRLDQLLYFGEPQAPNTTIAGIAASSE